MAGINGTDLTIFAEAYNTVLDNFTEGEQASLHTIAKELQAILEAAKQRQRDSVIGQSVGQLNY